MLSPLRRPYLPAALLSLAASAAAADPLRGGGGPMAERGVWLPDVLCPALAWLLPVQRHLMGDLQHLMTQLKDGDAPLAALTLVATGLVYGIVHAAGPGHGKVVVASYFSTRKAGISQAFLASGAIALVQAASAILVVTLFSVVLGWGSRTLMDDAVWLDVASFGLIGAFGLVIAWRAVQRRTCCHDHGCTHDHDHDHHHRPARRETLWAAAAVGLRPCTGAILILLFTFTNGLHAIGILAILAMAAGTAATVATVGLGAVGIRSVGERMLAGIGAAADWRRRLAIAGGVVIASAGFLMMAAALATAP